MLQPYDELIYTSVVVLSPPPLPRNIKGFLKYMQSSFYSVSVVLLQIHGGMVSHMEALATPSPTVHNTKLVYLPLKAYQFWLLVLEAVM